MRIDFAVVEQFGGAEALAERVGTFIAAREHHRFTVGEPAPTEDALVEAIVAAGGMLAVEILPPPDAPPAPRNVSPFAFRRRFTMEERAAITLAASRALEAGDATLQVWLDDVNSAQWIELDNPELRGGLEMIAEAGLIAADRLEALLS